MNGILFIWKNILLEKVCWLKWSFVSTLGLRTVSITYSFSCLYPSLTKLNKNQNPGRVCIRILLGVFNHYKCTMYNIANT